MAPPKESLEHGWCFFDDCLVSAQINLQSAKYQATEEQDESLRFVHVGKGTIIDLREGVEYETSSPDLIRHVRPQDGGSERARPFKSNRFSAEVEFTEANGSQTINFLGAKWSEKNGNRLPLIAEIIEGLVAVNAARLTKEAQSVPACTADYIKLAISQQSEAIHALFTLSGLGPLDRLPTGDSLSTANDVLTNLLLYMNSMESFVYSELQRATVEKDESMVSTLGPYAFAIG